MKTPKKRSSNAPKTARTSRKNSIYAEGLPPTLLKRFAKVCKQNNGTKKATIIQMIDLYCDIQEGKATVRRVKK